MDSSGSAQCPVWGVFCEDANKYSISINGDEFLQQLHDCQLPMRTPTHWVIWFYCVGISNSYTPAVDCDTHTSDLYALQYTLQCPVS